MQHTIEGVSKPTPIGAEELEQASGGLAGLILAAAAVAGFVTGYVVNRNWDSDDDQEDK